MSNEHNADETLAYALFQFELADYPKTWLKVDKSQTTGMWIARIVGNITDPSKPIMWNEDYGTGNTMLASPAELDVVASAADKAVAVLKAIEKAKAAIAKLQK